MISPLYIGLFLIPLASAHFKLDYPTSRGADSKNQRTFPCGGHPPTTNRTEWPVAGGPIHLTLGHDRSLVQVLLALGNDAGDNFNIVLAPTIQEEGPGKFCMTNVSVPTNIGVADGTNGTIQVITDSESGGGLYSVSGDLIRAKCVCVYKKWLLAD